MLPYFLGIGAQKSGTTWLYHNLNLHPEIYMPPKKELHYFDRSKKYLSSDLPTINVIDRGKDIIRYAGDLIKGRTADERKWYFKYRSGKYNNHWYESLFSYAKRGMKCGEVTPSYSILEIEDIKNVYNLIPNVKLIYVMRNPIDRVWSHVKHRVRKKQLKGYDCQEIYRHINSQASLLRGNYIRTIDNWQSIFPSEQMFIGFFDEIANDPKGLMKRIFDFLEVSSSKEIVERINVKKIHASIGGGMPSEIREYLGKMYYDMIKELSGRFNRYPSAWLSSIDK